MVQIRRSAPFREVNPRLGLKITIKAADYAPESGHQKIA
jgi:hypothetical protein